MFVRTPVMRQLVLAAVAVTAAGAATPAVASSPATTLRVGAVTLHPCRDVVRAWCGSRREPVDPAHPGAGKLSVGFVWYPASGTAAAKGTIVAEEGGPGFPSTGSAPEYRALFRPLLATRNLLLVDSRGTGGSALIDCHDLQGFPGQTITPRFNAMVAACGRRLSGALPGRGPGATPASDLYATAYATRDLAAVIRALRAGPVDLYGDSYGSWFAQSFASRYPLLLRSVVLDSTYSLVHLSPWYTSSASTARSAFRLVCARDLACTDQAGGDPWRRLTQLVARLRIRPMAGWTHNPQGGRVHETVSVRTMVDLTADAGFDPLLYRDLDAADRAALHGVPQPLLRLAAEAAQDDNATPSSAGDYSDGQYFAVACVDYPQLFDMRSPFAARLAQLRASIRTAPAAALRPFTPREWLSMNAYSEAFRACLRWPRIDRPELPAGPARPLISARVPVLVIGGDLDSWTPASDAPAVLRQIGPSARLVVLQNAVHTSTEGDILLTAATRCGRHLVRAFVAAPRRLRSLNAACAGRIPPIHTPGSFPRRLSGAAAATVVSGSAPLSVRRAASVAAEALGDATQTWWSATGDGGGGLYGGHFRGIENGARVHLHLHRVRFVSDAAVSGTGTWDIASGRVHATVTVLASGGLRYRFTVGYSDSTRLATVHDAGARLTLPAP
jgi:pimeloyl-ACP methyl ester carboxylesterase